MPGTKYNRAEVKTPKKNPVAKKPISTMNAANGEENVYPNGKSKLS